MDKINLAVSNKSLWKVVLAVFFIFLLVLIFMIRTGLGFAIPEDYWYGAGVPILWGQILFSLVLGILFSKLVNQAELGKKIPHVDMVVFILFWALTAYIWGREPLQSSHFMPDTGVNALYPYSDAATFDIGSQYALIGQGLFNGQYFDRSLYPALLTYMHLFAGQDSETLMMVQAVIYAVFPAILYLLGRELHGRMVGMSLGFVIMFRGLNAILGASMIDLAGPKMMLTDFPTAIGISLILLFLLKWINSRGKTSYAIWAGCFIGLTLLLRTHAIFLLPFILAFMVFCFKERKIVWVYGCSFLILGMFVSTLPLDMQNHKKGIPPFYMYYSRIQEVLRARYEVHSSFPPDQQNLSGNDLHQHLLTRSHVQHPICASKLCAIGNHFFHNLATSILYLPASFAFDDFHHTVKDAAPYWEKDWAGAGMGLQNYLFLFVNLGILSIGIVGMYAGRKFHALLPLLIYFAYILSNSLAFTSGGRYITPIDWIICIYYVAGLLKILFWLLSKTGINFKMEQQDPVTSEKFEIAPAISFRQILPAFVAIFMIGSLIPFAEIPFPVRYPEKTKEDVLLILIQQGLLDQADLTQTAVAEFLKTPNARLASGRLLYPRFYPSGKGEVGLDYPYTALDYRRLVFMVIGPFDFAPTPVILPIERSKPDLHASDVIVLGCSTDNFLDASVVFILSNPPKVYVRSEGLSLQCP